MFTTTRPAVSNLAASFDRSGATVPAALAQAFTRRTEAVDRFAARPGPGADALPVAVLAAIEAGVDPATDPTVQQIITAHALAGHHNLANDVEVILLDQIRATATATAPACLTAWRRRFDKAARSLTDAHQVLGGASLDDAATIVKLGPEATSAWSTARDALAVVDAIVSGWLALHQLTTGSLPHKARRLNLIADVDATVWIDNELDNADVDPWFALSNRCELRLASAPDYARQLAAIEGELRHRNDAATSAAHDRATGRIVNA